MLDNFRQYITDNKLFNSTNKILLGVSGGIDSMVLCDLFLKAGFNFAIAHCNFQLRGTESDGDTQLVTQYATSNNIPLHTIHFTTIEYANSNHISIQMAARDLRYNWFNELINNNGYDKIAVAHHADDNIETFFVNLARGTGINGLCGMPIVNQNIIRPLMFATRKQITNYATSNNIAYREDSSNACDKYARNKIRLNIISEFEKINPSFRQTMVNNLNHLQQINNFVSYEMAKQAGEICFEKNGNLYITIAKLNKLPYIELFLYQTLQTYGFKNEVIHKIALAINGIPGKQFYSHSHVLLKDRDYLIVSPVKSNSDVSEYPIQDIHTEIVTPIHLSFALINRNELNNISKSPTIAYFDFDKIKLPLVLRKWQHGDSFIPFGMKGRKKLSDYFSDNKFSVFDKQNQWLLTSGNEIVWIVGHRTDNRFKVDENTCQILQVHVKQ